MDNQAYQQDIPEKNDADNKDLPPPYSEFSLVRDDMDALRSQLEPGAFNAPLNVGEMTGMDMFKLIFLMAFPTFFFILSIILMATEED